MKVNSMSFEDMRLCREIYEAHPIPEHGFANPYMYFDPQKLSPIEFVLWCDIRCVGVLGIHPQYPIGKYYADFASPRFRFTIEADGKGFHQDWEKDEIRQREIESMGWRVFRLTGSAIMRNPDKIFSEVYGEYYYIHETDSFAYYYYELPYDEWIWFIETFKNECGYLFCEWLKLTYIEGGYRG